MNLTNLFPTLTQSFSSKLQFPYLDTTSSPELYECGGFRELRQSKNKKLLHLGIDFSVPAGTKVSSLTSGEVVLVDCSTFNRWGTRVIIKEGELYFLYGHLSSSDLYIGQEIKKGCIVGYIGDFNDNGKWFPHLHLQIMKQSFITQFKYLNQIDGYSEDETDINKIQGIIDPREYLLN
jgi:murein DD-endopeptidase MepM/ murein hydrolase activator NlpD